MNKFEHILILSPSYQATVDDDVVVPPLYEYLNTYSKKNPNTKISVITFHYPFTKDNYTINKITIYPFAAANGSIYKRPKIWRSILQKMKALNQEVPIDLIHCFWLNETSLIGQRFAKKHNIPIICTLMGQDALPQNKYLKFINTRNLQLVFLSPFHADTFQKIKPTSHHQIIPWGINQRIINEDKHSPTTRPIDILCVSSLIGLKRIELFVNIISTVVKTFPNLHTEIIGDGTKIK